MAILAENLISDFTDQIRGDVVLPADPSYDEVRKIWNAMIDRRPGMIVRCAGVSDVMHSVTLAREHNLLLAVRGGGHNIAGARESFDASAPYATGGVYINFMTEEEGDRVAAAYGAGYQRLVQLKEKYDPGNLFRLNQNIKPVA